MQRLNQRDKQQIEGFGEAMEQPHRGRAYLKQNEWRVHAVSKKIIAEYTRLTGATESYARTLGQIAAAGRRAASEQEKNMEKQRKTNAILQAQENTIDDITAKLKHWRSVLNSSELNGQQFRKAENSRLNAPCGLVDLTPCAVLMVVMLR